MTAPPPPGAGLPAARVRPRPLLRPLLRRPLGAAALAVLAVIVAACALAPVIAPDPRDASDFTHELSGPSAAHWLGTDELGRDILTRLLYGGQSTLLAAALAAVIAVAIGTVLGIAGGYLGGRTDRILTFWGDLLLTIPVLVILIVVVSVFPGSLYPAMLPLGLLLSAAPMRVIRSVTLTIREDLYIAAARVSGLSHWQIMRRHVLPRIYGPIVVQATLAASVAVMLASGLAFLGFGVQVPAPSWGTMVAEAASQYQQQPWFLVPTGGIIALTVLSLGLLGDALRDAVTGQWTGRAAGRLAAGRQPAAVRPPGSPQFQASSRTDAADPGPAPLLAVRDLRITVPGASGGTVLVSGMSFDLLPGRTLAIVGESGCGKSVTARALLGVAPPGGRIDGSIRLRGLDTELADAREAQWQPVRGRRIAFVGQEPMSGLDPAQTVGAALSEVVRRYSGCTRKQAAGRALALLSRVRLDDPGRVARLYPHQVSGGMAQRVTIARALAGDPEILVADEPTTALDVTIQADILALLRSLQLTSEIAVLLVTHDWGVVAGLADDVLVMYAGQAVERAAADAVFDSPRHPYTAALLRSDPHATAPGRALPVIAGTVPPPGQWPAGCRFAGRCQFVTAECTASEPALTEALPGHDARCIHADLLAAAR
ncbi:MAG TPA: dipeptide/oligopeptide/nickel ABC transporter permease/ATP-binding protein [Trebonia sp.]|jgi:peptide/nickel transport system permease protein|nr:dipeptide/oligopeptide/nickel ABC transporter permease/ATP-binding protein [Trebonia sp.]